MVYGRSVPVGLSDQNSVVDIMYSERHVVLGKFCLFARGFQFGLGYIVYTPDLQE
jgi:hypothetical protein